MGAAEAVVGLNSVYARLQRKLPEATRGEGGLWRGVCAGCDRPYERKLQARKKLYRFFCQRCPRLAYHRLWAQQASPSPIDVYVEILRFKEHGPLQGAERSCPCCEQAFTRPKSAEARVSPGIRRFRPECVNRTRARLRYQLHRIPTDQEVLDDLARGDEA
ncbi:MAG: hypothetical protein GY871_04690 [Actinomycetales bacterium]|nr:hypothetical protein [Actinomycetales bacterium]